jgi:hypothetical protein
MSSHSVSLRQHAACVRLPVHDPLAVCCPRNVADGGFGSRVEAGRAARNEDAPWRYRARGCCRPAERTARFDRRVSQCAVRHERGAGPPSGPQRLSGCCCKAQQCGSSGRVNHGSVDYRTRPAAQHQHLAHFLYLRLPLEKVDSDQCRLDQRRRHCKRRRDRRCGTLAAGLFAAQHYNSTASSPIGSLPTT